MKKYRLKCKCTPLAKHWYNLIQLLSIINEWLWSEIHWYKAPLPRQGLLISYLSFSGRHCDDIGPKLESAGPERLSWRKSEHQYHSNLFSILLIQKFSSLLNIIFNFTKLENSQWHLLQWLLHHWPLKKFQLLA